MFLSRLQCKVDMNFVRFVANVESNQAEGVELPIGTGHGPQLCNTASRR